MAEEIKVPALGESITEATIGRWLKKVGDPVAADEAIVELETDKVAMEVPSHVSGVITELVAAEGETVEVGAVIAKVDMNATASAPAAAPAAASTPAPAAAAPTAAAPAPASTGGTAQPLSPAVRKLIEEYALDASKIAGTGKDGRIVKADVMAAVSAGTAVAAPASAGMAPLGPREERVPMTRLRKRIAERLKDAQNTAAMLTTYNEVDMTQVMRARAQYRDLFEKKHGIRLGFMSFFVKACCLALKEIPSVNAEIDGDDIVYKNHYDIGVAVSAPTGLMVPVVRDADQMGFSDVEKTISGLGKKARDGKMGLDDLQGGTFTISNGGVFGSLMSSPILNPPQSAILGMHKIQDRPMAINGEVVIRPMMYLALSYDHRIIDGREAVTFLVRVKEYLEDPSRMLFDM
ncbi:MAG: 2-oxoglutarate dehydrogenase complex dihydrolipoyllysine-residue succinyltransferase [Sphingomonadales bacterium]|nr:2-oxoglutarate dehydrogenase complex dihydrolipoyllysine-residue succinyltransferase [Sphingomonadales bacterium]